MEIRPGMEVEELRTAAPMVWRGHSGESLSIHKVKGVKMTLHPLGVQVEHDGSTLLVFSGQIVHARLKATEAADKQGKK